MKLGREEMKMGWQLGGKTVDTENREADQ